MSDTFLKVVIVGFPLAFSLSWFTYWVVKLNKARKSKGTRTGKRGPGA